MSDFVFELDDEQEAAFTEAFGSLLTFFAKTCKLIYQPKIIDCDSCTTLVSDVANSHWQHGGPLRIDQQGICQLCGGTGKKTQEVSENISMSVAWQPKDFIGGYFKGVAPGVVMPKGVIQTRARIEDLPKIQKCIEMHLQVEIENYVLGKYRLLREGTDQFGIIKHKWIICFWDRI